MKLFFSADGVTVVEGNERYLISPDALIKLFTKAERHAEALQKIVQWSEAYPLDVFPEPTTLQWQQARALLVPGGISLDRVSASCMRHVVVGVGEIARKALSDDGYSEATTVP